MRRVLSCSTVCFVLAVGMIEAVPARPLFEPEPRTESSLPLAGSSWVGQDSVSNYRITFELDGTMTYGANNAKRRGGSWKLVGNGLYFEINNKYREFRGTVQGDTLRGDSWNVTGKKWQTLLHRVTSKQ